MHPSGPIKVSSSEARAMELGILMEAASISRQCHESSDLINQIILIAHYAFSDMNV
jgi:hypothetical protein